MANPQAPAKSNLPGPTEPAQDRVSVWLTFESPEMEQEYWLQHRSGDLARTRVFIAAVMVTFLVFAISDYRFFGRSATFGMLAIVRAIAMACSAIALFILRAAPTQVTTRNVILGWSLVCVACAWLVIASRPPDYTGHAIGSIAFMLGGYLLVPLPWFLQVISGVIIAMGYIALYWVHPPEYKITGLVLGMSFLTANVLGCVSSFQLDFWKRRQFLALRREIDTRKQLESALAEIRTLRGIIPICSHCKRIRDDEGAWNQVEVYVRDHSHAQFSHSICPECMKKHYAEFMQQ